MSALVFRRIRTALATLLAFGLAAALALTVLAWRSSFSHCHYINLKVDKRYPASAIAFNFRGRLCLVVHLAVYRKFQVATGATSLQMMRVADVSHRQGPDLVQDDIDAVEETWGGANLRNAFGFHWERKRFSPGTPPYDLLISLPCWFACGVLFLGLLACLRPAFRQALARRRRRQGRCGACGYDLRASTGICPECGTTDR